MRRAIPLAAVLALLTIGPAQAAIVTLSGTGFDVQYDDTLLGLFGTPTLSGNGQTIIFTPTQFSAFSLGAQGTVFKNDTVVFDLIPRGGNRVAQVTVLEAGDYKIVDRNATGIDPTVDVSGEIRLTNLFDGVSFAQSTLIKNAPLNVVCPNSSCAPTPWTAAATVFAPVSWSDGTSPSSPTIGAPTVRFLLEDLLTAESFVIGDSAFIQKKQASSTISINVDIDNIDPVPVPPALPLLGTALVAMLGLRRRPA